MQIAWRSGVDATAEDEPATPVATTELRHDHDLIHVARAQQDIRAFGPLYEQYSVIIFHYCLRRVGNREVAADATSIVFAKAIAALPKFRPDPKRQGSTFRAWLFTIAHNVVIDHRRRDRSELSLDTSAENGLQIADLADADSTPEEHALLGETIRTVRQLLDTLPDRQRAVTELRLSGLSGAEIAGTLGISESAVKSIQFRAYSALRDTLRAKNITSSEPFQ